MQKEYIFNSTSYLYTFLNSFVIKWFITNRRGGSALKLEWSLHRKKRECVPFPRIASNQNLFLNQKELFSYQNCRLLKAGCLNKNKSTRHTYHIFLSALSLKWFIIKSVHNMHRYFTGIKHDLCPVLQSEHWNVFKLCFLKGFMKQIELLIHSLQNWLLGQTRLWLLYKHQCSGS